MAKDISKSGKKISTDIAIEQTNDARRSEANKHELIERLTAACINEGPTNPVDGLTFFRHCNPTAPAHAVFTASICVVAQGAKEVLIGDDRLRYDPAQFILSSLDMPVVGQVIEATPDKPFLGLKLLLDPALIASVSVEAGMSAPRSDTSVRSFAVSEMPAELFDAFVRLVRLTENRTDFQMVSPLVIREIVYRLLKSDHGPRIRQMASFGGNTHRITKAVQTLRTRFSEPLAIEELAQDLGMSVSSFHQHFKTTTSMSPLQFQKLIRLQEARRLLVAENLDASAVAMRVGYEDASQFNREYKRLFGEPPMRDANRFKKLAETAK